MELNIKSKEKLFKSLEATITELEKLNSASQVDGDHSEHWKEFWHQGALQIITNSLFRLKKLDNGEIHIYDDSVEQRPFWENLIGNVRSTLWTTNISRSNSDSSMGRIPDTSLLMAQLKAINRGVKITRLFAFDPASGRNGENDLLATVMLRQLQIGIDVHCIPMKSLEHQVRSGTKFMHDDFMVIDDNLIYLSKIHEKTQQFRGQLINNKSTVNAAKELSEKLMGHSYLVTLDNIGKFPNL